MQQETVRVMRVIIYEGGREKVEKQIKNSIHGTREFGTLKEGFCKITAITINEFSEIIEEHECFENNP